MIEHYLCSLLLIAAAGVIGRLYPRKKTVEVAPAPAAAPTEYGLSIPPGAEEIHFTNIENFSTYVSGGYKSVTLKVQDKFVLKFKGRGGYIHNEVDGVVSK